jgi:ABC-type transport system involved in multi-copper enzyme maturation permease subunit
MGRLIAVELRKMVNTRSGFWVPIAVTLLTLLVAIIGSVNHGGTSATFIHIFNISSRPAAFLLPVMGVLLICGEWSQRTTLTTFTLVPNRGRVIAAKFGASVMVSTIALIVCLLCTLLFASALGHAPGGTGSLPWQVILQGWLELGAGMAMGLAFGAAILVSAPAIVAYLLLPVVWNGIVGGFHVLTGLDRWLDSGNTLNPLTLHALNGTQWAHVAATLALWVGIPTLIGWARIGRGDLD